jgi:SAM-dependent methyltransferase
MIFKQICSKILRPKGKENFLLSIDFETPKILDVGCGNNSPYKVKSLLPKAYYVGIDILEYKKNYSTMADQFLAVTPDGFTDEISKFTNEFDVVISSHNLEHCNDRWGTLKSMLSSLKVGGSIYISFPCQETQYFPSRAGTLNYFDDPTHQLTPPDFNEIKTVLASYGFFIEYENKHYRPFILYCIGFLLEPISAFFKRKLYGTWEFYGFESVIWARKVGNEKSSIS